MSVEYKKLFKLLIDKEMTNSELANKAGFSLNVITKMKRNQYISLRNIESICSVLDVPVDKILEFKFDEENM